MTGFSEGLPGPGTATGAALWRHAAEEGFELSTRLLVFDRLWYDQQAPEAYGAKVTYDIPLRRLKNHREGLQLAIVEALGSQPSYAPAS
jgi:hypothetical protein